MNVEFFKEQMQRLSGLKFFPANFDTHWEVLHDLPEDVLEAAVGRASRTRIEFPAPVELRQDADQAKPRYVAPEPEAPVLDTPVVLGTLPTGKVITAERVWAYYCDECSDTGTREYWCGQSTRQPWLLRKRCYNRNCQKMGDGYAHTWSDTCPCADSNPAIKRKRERDAKYAAEKATTR